MKTDILNEKNMVVGEIDLPDSVFNVEWNPELVHFAFVVQTANSRQPLAHVKDRGEVAGGGKKPWRQKGTGRARHGSIRSPIWVGGGVTHGPTKNKIYSKKINKKQKQKALASLLSKKISDKQIKILDSISLPNLKTKSAGLMLSAFKNNQSKNFTLVLSETSKNYRLAFRNIPKVKTIAPGSLNIYDLLITDTLLIDQKSIPTILDNFFDIPANSTA